MMGSAFEERFQKIVTIIELKSIIVMVNMSYVSVKVQKYLVVLLESQK